MAIKVLMIHVRHRTRTPKASRVMVDRFIAIRTMHFPHWRGGEEARSRGHGSLIQLLADLVAEANERLYNEVQWVFVTKEDEEKASRKYLEILRDLASRIRRKTGLHASLIQVEPDAGDMGYGILIDGSLLQQTGEAYLIYLSPHDEEIPVLHFFAIYTNMGRKAIPYILYYLRKSINTMWDNPDLYYGYAELVFNLSRGTISINKVKKEEE